MNGMGQRITALAIVLALLPACWGYNSSAKRWSYAGNAMLMAAGGGAIAADVTATAEPCAGTGCQTYQPPFSGLLLAGALVAAAGFVGMLLTATRPEVKTTR